MVKRLQRVILCFLGLVAAYWLYSLLAVPFIEPQLKVGNPSVVAAGEGEHERSRQRHLKQLTGLFPDGAWELNNPKVVETDQGLFLFQNYTTAPNGRLEVKPCTVVLHSSTAKRGGKGPSGRPIVMYVPAGAELQFDGESDTTRAVFGRLRGALLRGDIRIESRESEPGAADSLLIQTRDIQISEQRIWTPHRVDFRVGNSIGSGHDLVIALAPSSHARGKSDFAPAVGGVSSLELTHVDQIHLQLGRNPTDEADQPATQPAERAGLALFGGPGQAPLEIMCQGPFRFDFVDQVASFEDHVDVVRLAENGISDQLSCEQLLIYFGVPDSLAGRSGSIPKSDSPSADSGKETPANQDTPNNRAMSIARIVAMGRPVVLRAPSIAATAQAEYLEYNLQTRRIVMRIEGDGPPTNEPQAAVLRYGTYEIVAPYVEYEVPPNPRQLGQTWSAGPGQFTILPSKDHPTAITASWGKELHIRPQQDLHAISLTAGAAIHYGEANHFSADALHVWLRELPGDEALKGDVTSRRMNLQPDRLVAQGNVRIESPQVDAHANRLEAWFREGRIDLSSKPKGLPSSVSSTARGGATHATGEPDPEESRPRPLNVRGNAIRLQVLLVERRPLVDELVVDGNVRLNESQAPTPADLPLVIEGDTLQAQNLSTGRVVAFISGQPAQVSARGLFLTGSTVQLQQFENMLRIDGAGQMRVQHTNRAKPNGERLYENPKIADRNKVVPITVTWQDQMIFDGAAAHFLGRIQVRGRQTLENGDVHSMLTIGEHLQVTLSERIQFGALKSKVKFDLSGDRKSGQPAVDIRQLGFRGPVYLENQTYRQGAQVAMDRLWVENLTLDQSTGIIHGDCPRNAPGECRRVQWEDSATAALDQDRATPPAQRRMMLLFVSYRGSVDGNMHTHQVEFQDQVRTWYAPVEDWADQSTPPAGTDLGPDQVLLDCDRLALVEMTGYSAAQRAFELNATGNVSITGQQFKARGGRLSYARTKDQLVLEADNRGDAELWKLPASSAQPDAVARTIKYWPRTGAIDVQRAKHIDLTKFRTPVDRAAKPSLLAPR